jgi:hypothetical protein
MVHFNFFRNKTFFFVKIESWNFQHLFDLLSRETSQNFSLFGQLFITHTKMSSKCLSEWAEILQGFTEGFSILSWQKKTRFIPKFFLNCTMYHGQFFFQPPDAVIYINSRSIYGSGLNYVEHFIKFYKVPHSITFNSISHNSDFIPALIWKQPKE